MVNVCICLLEIGTTFPSLIIRLLGSVNLVPRRGAYSCGFSISDLLMHHIYKFILQVKV